MSTPWSPRRLAFASMLAALLLAVAWLLILSAPESDPTASSSEAAAVGIIPPDSDDSAPIASLGAIAELRQHAQVHLSRQQYDKAAEIAVELATLDVPDPIAELMLAFEWHLRAADPVAAESDLRRAIEISPSDPRGHRFMAQLLNSQGRRFEASAHALELARDGSILPREALSMIERSGPYQIVSFHELVGDLPGTLFELGKARDQFIAKEDPEAALATLDRLASQIPGNVSVEALRGRLIAEQADDDRFRDWLSALPDGIERNPEYWLAIGIWLNHHGRDRQAVRALAETMRLDPTNRRALRTLSASLNRLGENEKAAQVQETLAILDRIFRVATSEDAEDTLWVAAQLQKLVRPWESVAWLRLGLVKQGTFEKYLDELRQRAAQIRDWEQTASVDRIRDARVARMLGFDIAEFPLPQLEATIATPERNDAAVEPSRLKFQDVAQSIGVDASFVSEYPLDRADFFLYQANGGGLGAIDYDLDGRCDLYIAQSGGDPNQPGSSHHNQLFRNQPGDLFAEVTAWSGTDDRGYGQGVCAGDLNQDGFPDLLVANIGANVVYLNQGDGTFRERSDLIVDNSARWTSSIAIGDLDGDQLPEIVEINYLDDPLIFERRCLGRVLECTPQRFRAATDRIFQSAGDGTFREWRGGEDMDQLPNYGFGVVIADFDGQHGNDLFISNDGDHNHFWKSVARQSTEPSSDSDPKTTVGDGSRFGLVESAGISGCSVGTSGLVQACMGIASGDFDRNGLIDLLVTNFHNEPVNLFLNSDSKIFFDEALKYRLVQPSKSMLGFGAQAADFDNDGWLDVAIANGHIYDARYADIPFRMVSQLLRGSPRGFSLQSAESAGPYWSRKQLARTLALFDFNRDGRMDMVSNHLDQPIAILRNDSESAHWIQLELVGVASDRTAIGARVVVRAAGQDWTAWQTGGDGYMCANEHLIHVGIGEAATIDSLEIHWPSGTTQRFESIGADQRYLAIEGEQELFRQ